MSPIGHPILLVCAVAEAVLDAAPEARAAPPGSTLRAGLMLELLRAALPWDEIPEGLEAARADPFLAPLLGAPEAAGPALAATSATAAAATAAALPAFLAEMRAALAARGLVPLVEASPFPGLDCSFTGRAPIRPLPAAPAPEVLVLHTLTGLVPPPLLELAAADPTIRLVDPAPQASGWGRTTLDARRAMLEELRARAGLASAEPAEELARLGFGEVILALAQAEARRGRRLLLVQRLGAEFFPITRAAERTEGLLSIARIALAGLRVRPLALLKDPVLAWLDLSSGAEEPVPDEAGFTAGLDRYARAMRDHPHLRIEDLLARPVDQLEAFALLIGLRLDRKLLEAAAGRLPGQQKMLEGMHAAGPGKARLPAEPDRKALRAQLGFLPLYRDAAALLGYPPEG